MAGCILFTILIIINLDNGNLCKHLKTKKKKPDLQNLISFTQAGCLAKNITQKKYVIFYYTKFATKQQKRSNILKYIQNH